ncbi:MAG: DUF6514 family protein [Clostridiaceae bacterium]
MSNYQGLNYTKDYKVVKNLSTIVENRTYSYRIIKSQFISSQGDMVQAYGIEAERTDSVDKEVIEIERAGIEYISPDLHKVSNLLLKLHDNNVSPIHLTDVLGEYVDDYTSDFNNFSIKNASNAN